MKWNEMDEMSVEKWWNDIGGRGKREKPREKPTQTPSASNRLRHEAALIVFLWYMYNNVFYPR